MYITVFITVPGKKEGEIIARGLIENRLAACVSMIKAVDSLFLWEGKVDRAKEVLLIVKSKRQKFRKISAFVKSTHRYRVPEIIALPVLSGNPDYLSWIDDSLKQSR